MEDLTSPDPIDSGDAHMAWIKSPGPDWTTNPGEPTTVPNRIDVDGVEFVWDEASGQYVRQDM